MEWVVVVVFLALVVYFARGKQEPDLSVLPERFIVFDLETTGLKPEEHEIIEFGAIRVNRDSKHHESFQALVRPKKKIPKKITEITGITQEMVDQEGEPLESALPEFLKFVGDLPLVSFNAEFDMAFLERAIHRCQPGAKLGNRVSCALKMARRAWPGRKSYRLIDLAKDGGMSLEGTHRAVRDCQRALIVYCCAAARLRSAGGEI